MRTRRACAGPRGRREHLTEDRVLFFFSSFESRGNLNRDWRFALTRRHAARRSTALAGPCRSAGVEIGLVARFPRRSGVANLGSRHSFPRRDRRRARSSAALALAFVPLFGAQIRSASAFKASDFRDLRHLLVLRAARARPRARSGKRAHRPPRTFRGGRRRGRHRGGSAFEPERGHGRSASVADVTPYGDEGVIRVRLDDDARPRYSAGRAGTRAGCRTARVRRGDAHDAGTGTTPFHPASTEHPATTEFGVIGRVITLSVTHRGWRRICG